MIVVIGGESRNVGKTTIACAMISALRDWNWIALRITHHAHGFCVRNGEPCPCEQPTHLFAIDEEASGRFLEAGARRAYWVRTPDGSLEEAMPRIRKLIEGQNAIIESNSVMEFLEPDFFAIVVDDSVADFEPCALRFRDRANAVVTISNSQQLIDALRAIPATPVHR